MEINNPYKDETIKSRQIPDGLSTLIANYIAQWLNAAIGFRLTNKGTEALALIVYEGTEWLKTKNLVSEP